MHNYFIVMSGPVLKNSPPAPARIILKNQLTSFTISISDLRH